MLTRKGKYGLKAMLTLAREHGHGPMLIGDLAEQDAIPKKFLENILLDAQAPRPRPEQERARTAAISSVGRRSASASATSSARSTVPLALVSCVSQTAYAPCEECVTEHDCAVRRVFQQVRDETARILDGTTLAGRRSRAAADRRSRPAPPSNLVARVTASLHFSRLLLLLSVRV